MKIQTVFDIDQDPEPKSRASKAPSPLPPLTLQGVQTAVYGLLTIMPDPDRHPDPEPPRKPRAYRARSEYTQYHFAMIGLGVLLLLIVAAIWLL